MALLCPPPETAEIRSHAGPEEVRPAESDAAYAIRSNLGEVRRHWLDQSEQPHEELNDDDLESYLHVPLKIVGTRKVRYVRVEQFKPRRHDFEDDIEL